MINFDKYVNENKTVHNKNWIIYSRSFIQNLNNRRFRIRKNKSLNLIDSQPDIDKMCLYAKDPYEPKYQYLINKREPAGIKYFKDPKAFIEYSNDMRDVCKNISYYNPNKENEILPVFDDMIADMINNKKQNSIVTELFIRGRKYFSCFYYTIIF